MYQLTQIELKDVACSQKESNHCVKIKVQCVSVFFLCAHSKNF